MVLGEARLTILYIQAPRVPFPRLGVPFQVVMPYSYEQIEQQLVHEQEVRRDAILGQTH